MLHNQAITALLNDAAECMKQRRPHNAHRLLCIADRIAQKDKTVSTARRDAIRYARLCVVAAF